MRTSIGALVLIVIALKAGMRIHVKDSPRGFLYVCLAGICTGLSWVTLYEAYRLTGVGISSLLYYCAPVIVMIASVPLFGEKLTGQRVVGFVVVFAGTLMVSMQAVVGNGSALGIVLAALSALFHAGMVIFSKKAPEINSTESTTIQLLVSFLVACVFLLFNGGLGFIGTIPLSAWPAIIFLGVANTGIGCLMYYDSIAKLPAQTVATLGYLEPMSAVFFSAALLGESLTIIQWIGAAVIMGGAFFSERTPKPLTERKTRSKNFLAPFGTKSMDEKQSSMASR